MNKNIKDVFESLSPSESQIDSIYKEINLKRKSKTPSSFFKVFALGCSFVLVIIICTCSIFLRNNASSTDINNHKEASKQTSTTTKLTARPEQASFGSFIITTYITKENKEYLNGNDIVESNAYQLIPNTKLLLMKYDLASSMTPGLPFTFHLNGDGTKGISLKVDTDSGQLLTWDIPSGKVSEKGTSTTCAIGETLYWNPMSNKPKNTGLASKAVIRITALENNKEIGTQEISITEKDYLYYAELGELNLLVE